MTVKALIIGCGSIGTKRARILKSLGVEVWLLDIDSVRRNKLAHELQCFVIGGITSKFDVALICTPSSSHLALAQQCAEAGLNLFIEKPLASTFHLSVITHLVRTMQEQGVWGILGQSYRFLQSLCDFRVRYIDKPILSAEIWQGQHLADWRPGTDYRQGYAAQLGEGGIVLDSLAHSLDLAQWLFGKIEAITALIGASGELGISTDDVATCLLRMQSGAQVTIHNDYWQRPRGFHISVVTAFEGENTFHWMFDPREASAMYLAEMQHLVKCVEKHYGGQPDIYQGIINTEWADAAQRASATGTWQRIENEWAKLAGRK